MFTMNLDKASLPDFFDLAKVINDEEHVEHRKCLVFCSGVNVTPNSGNYGRRSFSKYGIPYYDVYYDLLWLMFSPEM
jgi:hypothetical protein